MNNKFISKTLALALSALVLVAAIPLSNAAAGTAENVTFDVSNSALSATSKYPVSIQVSGIEEDAFANDTENLLRNDGAAFEVCNYDGTAISTAPSYGTNGSGGFASLYDGMIAVGLWGTPYKTDELGNHYNYWYTSSGLSADNTPKGYVTFTLDGEYTLDDFYIMSAAERKTGILCNYNVYFSTDKETLFESENQAITYQYTYGDKLNTANGGQNADGQIYIFTSEQKPAAQYVGVEVISGGTIAGGWLFLSEVGFHGTKSNVTFDVENSALSATSKYPVSIQVSNIGADAFTNDTDNIMHNEGVSISVYDKENTQITETQARPVASGGRGEILTAIRDGMIDDNGWKPYEIDGAYYYPYWYITGGLTDGGNPEGYVVIDLGGEYTIDDFYIMTAYRARGALSAYDVYFSDELSTLFDDENSTITYSYTGYSNNDTGGKLNTVNSNSNSEGQIYTFMGEEKPTASYVGLKINEGGLISAGWLFLAELGFHGEEIKDIVAATLDLSALNDETSVVGGTPYVGEEYSFTVATKNGANVEKVYADGTELTATDGVYTIDAVTEGMKITVKTDRDSLATTNDIWNGVDLSLNDSLYGKAIWDEGVTYNETVMLYSGRESIKLLYPIDDIISVRSYDLQTVYWRGEDFDIVNGEFVPLAGGNLPIYTNAEDIKSKNDDGSTNYTQISAWESSSHNYQCCITYTHSTEWDGTAIYNKTPTSKIGDLSNFYNRITSGEDTQIVFYGDSITVGCNASGTYQQSWRYSSGADASTLTSYTWTMYGKLGLSAVPEWGCDSYAVQLTNAMKSVYNNPNVTMVNRAIGSSASAWGSKDVNLEFLLGDTKPDLLVLAYGMNESNNTVAAHNTNIAKIIDYVRTLNPDCSVLLVSTFHPAFWDSTNSCWVSNNLSALEEGYYELAEQYDNVAVAPIYSMFGSMLSAKEPCDYTSNLYNHPNDFGARLYGDTLTAVLSPAETEVMMNLELDNNINAEYNLVKSQLDAAGYTEPYAEFTLNGNTVTVTGYTEKDGYISFAFSGVNPKNIGDTITATFYAKSGDSVIAFKTVDYSIKQYCDGILEGYSGTDAAEVKAVVKGLLNFAAASQTYFGYNTQSLVNVGYEDYSAPRTLTDSMAVSANEGSTVKWLSAGLNFSSNVALRLKINAADASGLKVKATVNGTDWWIPASAFTAVDGGYYVYFNKLTVAQMSDTVDFTVYNSQGEPISDTLTYSIESYAAAKAESTAAIGDLVRAMMSYGDAANALSKLGTNN